MKLDYVRQYYKVPAETGRRVTVHGKPGIIVEGIHAYIGVNFDHHKPGVVLPCHPTDGVVYGELGIIREEKLTKSQRKYREFLRIDHGMKFYEWMRFKNHKGRRTWA